MLDPNNFADLKQILLGSQMYSPFFMVQILLAKNFAEIAEILKKYLAKSKS